LPDSNTVMSSQANQLYEFGPFRLDAAERFLLRDGEVVPLTPKAFDLLLVLVEHHGHLLEKEELLKRVWPDTFIEEANLSYNISLIRKALGDGDNGQKFIETVPKRGYRFVAGVRQMDAEQAEIIEAAARDIEEEVRPGPLTSKVKRHRKGALLALAALVITIGGMAFGLYKFITQSKSKSSGLEPKIVPLTSFLGSESHPAFSPDGKQIAFVWSGEKGDNENIYIKLIGAGEPLQLTTDPASDTGPTWSPSGRYIAFLRQSEEGSGIYIVPALGGTERKLTKADNYIPTEFNPLRLAWHPEGEFLAVAERSSPAEPFSIFLLSAETGEKRRLTQPPAQYFGDWNPAFSPDGKTLAFTRGVNGVSLDIHVVPVSGGEPRRLTFDGAHKKSLAWTPDGREIVFSSSRGGSVNTAMLWKIPAAGGTPERLIGVGQNVFTLAIDRQGNRLAYEQRILDTNIYRIDASDSTGQSSPHTKLISSTFQDNSPDYSPDGKRIAFVTDRTGSLEIWLCDGDGANPLQLTNFGGPHTGTPRWSPDGRLIAFDSGVEGNQEIFTISADGGKPRRLTSDPALDMVPSWSRDGRWIYFGSNRSGDWQVWKVPVEGGQAVQVTRQGGLEGFESADGKFIYYSKGFGLPNIWRLQVEGGEETPILELQKTGHGRSWAIVEKGIYFASAQTPSSSVVEFFSFSAGRVERRVATLERSIKEGPPGLTVSPDGRWILYTRIDQSGSDIMLMENFH
jgi:Tol biopolymer transport system component/DNA-binding winged helix-turn-helix (wHTH) protein